VLDFAESVRVHPADLRSVIATIGADPEVPPLDVRVSLETVLKYARFHDGERVWSLPAQELCRVVRYADPCTVYGLSLATEAALTDNRLIAYLMVWSAVREQAPRTAAALELLAQIETELAITAAHLDA
jgi:hypothetical protein